MAALRGMSSRYDAVAFFFDLVVFVFCLCGVELMGFVC
jgi:hypothetical protein